MKLEKWLKYIDPLTDVQIWESNEDETPVFEGAAYDIPWTLTKRKIGRINNSEEPIFICSYVNQHKTELPLMVINII